MEDFIHIKPNKKRSSFGLILFLIPIIVFVVLAIIIINKNNNKNQMAASTELETAVLGEQSEQIEK